MKVIRSLIICALSAMHLSLYSCDEYDYYYDCDEQINSLAPLTLSESEKDVKYLLKLDTIFDQFDQEMDYKDYSEKIKYITDLLVEKDKKTKIDSNKLYLSYEKYRKAWNKANQNNQIKIDLPKVIDLNKIRVKQSDVEENDYKNKQYQKECISNKTEYRSFPYGQNMLYGLSYDLRNNDDETFKNCLVHHIVNLMIFLPQEILGMSKKYNLQVGKYDYDGFIAAFNKLKYIIKNSKKSTDRNEDNIKALFATIRREHNEQAFQNLTGKSFQDLEEDIKEKIIDISLDGESIYISQYNHNYDRKEQIIQRMEKVKDEIFKTLNDSGFLGFINTALFNIKMNCLKHSVSTQYQIITPFDYEEQSDERGCITTYAQDLTGKQNAIMSFCKHKLGTDDGKSVKCDRKLLIKQINCNKDLKVDELGVIKNVPDNMQVFEYLKHLLKNEINMNFFNNFKNNDNNIYVFNDACKNGKLSIVLSNLYNDKTNKGSDFWKIVEYPLGNNIYTNYIKTNYNSSGNYTKDIKLVSKDDFFKSKSAPTVYIDNKNIEIFLQTIQLSAHKDRILNSHKNRIAFKLSYANNNVYAQFPEVMQIINKQHLNFKLVKKKVQEYLSVKDDDGKEYRADPNTINKFLESIGIHDDNLTNNYAEIQIKKSKEDSCDITFSVPLQFCDGTTYDQILFYAIYCSNGNLGTKNYFTPIDIAFDDKNINVVNDNIFNQLEKGKIYRIYLKGTMHDKHTSVFVELDESNTDTNIKRLKDISYLKRKTQKDFVYKKFELISESTANRLKKKADGSEYKYALTYDTLHYAGYKLDVNNSDLNNFIFIDKTLAKSNEKGTITDIFGAQKYSKIEDLKDYITIIN